MFRSFGSSLITLFIVLMAGFMLLFISKGSSDLAYERVPMENDKSNATYIAEFKAELQKTQSELTDVASTDNQPMEDTPKAKGDGEKVVLWISVPGFRGDLIEATDTPFFDRMKSEGGSTTKYRPNFPPLTYPGHMNLATGTTPEKHGITLDRIRNGAEVVDKPMDAALLTAEPIWTTATRQGIRTLVHDWPLSQNQSGENAAAHFLTSYDPALTDQQRLDALWEAWSNDKDEKKLRLLMVKLNGLSDAALANGPKEDGTLKAVSALDAALGEFFKKIEEKWTEIGPPDGNLGVILTTDHGMVSLEKNINLRQLLGEDLGKHLDIVAHDAIGHLYFKDMPENEGQKTLLIKQLDDELKKRIYFRTLKPEELPADWGYNVPGRIGDRVLVLKTGYAFTDHEAAEPVFDPSETSTFSAFGFPVEDSIRMSGQAIIWGWPNSPASGDLGEIGSQSFHATVCKMLGIQPAAGAVTDTLPVN